MLITGASLVIYLQSSGLEHLFLLIIGFSLLMGGLFGIYSSITNAKPNLDPFAVQNEEEE